MSRCPFSPEKSWPIFAFNSPLPRYVCLAIALVYYKSVQSCLYLEEFFFKTNDHFYDYFLKPNKHAKWSFPCCCDSLHRFQNELAKILLEKDGNLWQVYLSEHHSFHKEKRCL